MKKFFLFLCLISSIGWATAQVKEYSGIVIGADDNEPLVGAHIQVKGTEIRVATDVDGLFVLKNVPIDKKVIIVSSVGFERREVNLSEKMHIVLQVDVKALDEYVVVAYGVQKKSSLTGSVTSVDSKKIAKFQVSDAAKALEGSIPGLITTTGNGQPGATSDIRIRGIGSINASSSPLIIVDGAPYDGGLTSINSSDIESMNVLKDAASAALYGARGANGVILISTKRGSSDKTNVSFDMRIGNNYRGVPEYDIMTSPGMYYETYWEALYNKSYFGQRPTENAPTEDQWIAMAKQNASAGLIVDLGYNIYNVDNDKIVLENGLLNPQATLLYKDPKFNNWIGELYSPQLRQEYNLSISKGNKDTKIYFSLGYLDDKGYNVNSGFDRISTRLSVDSKLTPWLDVKIGSNFSRTFSNSTATGGAYSNTFQWTRSIAPIYPIYQIDGNGNYILDNGQKVFDFGEPNEYHGERAYGSQMNLLATQTLNLDSRENYYTTQNLGMNIALPFGLTFSTTGSLYANWFYYNYFMNPSIGDGKTYNGLSDKTRSSTISLDFNQILRWERQFDLLSVNAMVGHESHSRNYSALGGRKSNYLDPKNHEFDNAAKIGFLSSYSQPYSLEGYFGQVTLDYENKYYVSSSYRRDGSSVFHPKFRWGNFWSVGASWRLSQESFLIDNDAIDNLKLKASYGLQGNDNLYLPNGYRSYTPYQTLYSVNTDGENLILKPSFLGRKEVTWEKNYNFNVGFEFSFFKGLLLGEFEYFDRKTKDLLFNLPISESTGFSSIPTNIGDMTNKGFELSLNSNIIKKKNIQWNLGVNLSKYKNIVTYLPDEFREKGITRGSQKIIEGGSIYDFYMVKYAGVDPENGDALYWIKNTETNEFEKKGSGAYETTDSKQFIGNSIPKLYGGINSTLNLYGFDLSTQFVYRIGGLVQDQQYSGLMHTGTKGQNWHKDILNRWSPKNTNTSIPRIQAENQSINQSSDRFLTDGSFFSIKNITLGYDIDKSILKYVGVSKLRAYVAADNVAIWTKRQGLDPRLNFSGTGSTAVYSPIRTVSLGLLINL